MYSSAEIISINQVLIKYIRNNISYSELSLLVIIVVYIFCRQLDFLKKCLGKDPNERWTCEQLLRHSYFDNFHFKMPDVETEEFEKLKKYRERSRVSLMIECAMKYSENISRTIKYIKNEFSTEYLRFVDKRQIYYILLNIL